MHLSLLAVMCSGLSRKAGNDLPLSGQLREFDTQREKSVSGPLAPEAGVRAPVVPEECRHCWSRSHTTLSPPGLGRKATKPP